MNSHPNRIHLSSIRPSLPYFTLPQLVEPLFTNSRSSFQKHANNIVQGHQSLFGDLDTSREKKPACEHSPSARAKLFAANTPDKTCEERDIIIIGLYSLMHDDDFSGWVNYALQMEKLGASFWILKVKGLELYKLLSIFG